MEKGRLKGRVEDARNFKALGVSVDIISKATGLPPEEIEKL
jgi:predicted transposase YdaD